MSGGKLLVVGSIAYDNIKTPLDSVQWALGGSASYAALAASFFAPTMLCGIVGKDFKKSDLARLSRRGIDTSNVEIDPNGETFFWSGEYLDNFNSRETLETRVNVYENYVPKLNDAAKNADFVLLGNIGPDVQKCALDAMLSSPFVILDTMNLWIDIANRALKELIKRADIFIVNDSEAKLISGERNIILAGESLLKLGAKSAVVKTGEYGAMLFHKDGFFVIPAYPVRDLRDPTGAGDTFAGALAGVLAGSGKTDFTAIKNAMLTGAAAASMTVESFSSDKLEEAGLDEIKRRQDFIRRISEI